jgi:hypothetical protein
VLRYSPPGVGNGGYRGAYKHEDGVIKFVFEYYANTAAQPPWDDAPGTLEDDSLTVEYEVILQQSDFENAVYRLMP